MPKKSVNGTTINYQLDGPDDAAETVVLINGLADDLQSWEAQIPAFVDSGYKVLRFDNRGIGQSDSPKGPYSSKLLADDAKALVDAVELRDFHLLGVSMGGMIAQEYALAYAADLRSLTLACTYGKADEFCQQMFSMWSDLAKGLGVPFVMRDVMLWAFTVPFFEERQDDVKAFNDAMAQLEMPVEAYLSQLAVIQDHDTLDKAGAINVPTMVLAGEQDILIPVRLSERLHKKIPGAKWQTVAGGHACLWEHPDPFNQACLNFFRANAR